MLIAIALIFVLIAGAFAAAAGHTKSHRAYMGSVFTKWRPFYRAHDWFYDPAQWLSNVHPLFIWLRTAHHLARLLSLLFLFIALAIFPGIYVWHFDALVLMVSFSISYGFIWSKLKANSNGI